MKRVPAIAFCLLLAAAPAVGSKEKHALGKTALAASEDSCSKNHFILEEPCTPDVDITTWTWKVVSPMAMARVGHSATRLPDGRVLVAGGYTQGGYTASSEIFDPGNGAWTAAADMKMPRAEHVAALMNDGRVLVVSGEHPASSSFSLGLDGSTEIYDPVTGQWTFTGAVQTPRMGATLTTLPDGRVLLLGGVNDSDRVVSRGELYDPASGTWRYTTPMAVPRFSHTSTLLADGRVLVASGWGDDDIQWMTDDDEVYDPADDTWTTVERLSTARGSAAAARLPDGSVLVTGGYTNNLYSWTPYSAIAPYPLTYATSERVLPDGHTMPASDLHYSRSLHTAVRLPDGSIMVTGGFFWAPWDLQSGSQARGTLSSTEIYDSVSGTWWISADLHQMRCVHQATALANGAVLVTGGFDDSNRPLNSAEVFGPPR